MQPFSPQTKFRSHHVTLVVEVHTTYFYCDTQLDAFHKLTSSVDNEKALVNDHFIGCRVLTSVSVKNYVYIKKYNSTAHTHTHAHSKAEFPLSCPSASWLVFFFPPWWQHLKLSTSQIHRFRFLPLHPSLSPCPRARHPQTVANNRRNTISRSGPARAGIGPLATEWKTAPAHVFSFFFLFLGWVGWGGPGWIQSSLKFR